MEIVNNTHNQHTPYSQTARDSGKRNTDFVKNRAILILALPNICVVRHASEVCKVFGFADEIIMTGYRLRQENFKRRGLFINYQYVSRGIANLIVAITNNETRESYLRILNRLSRKPLGNIQEVFA